MATPSQRLAEILLGRPVVGWIDDQRAEGRSYRQIAKSLADLTKGQVDVAPETLRGWTVSTPDRAAS